MWIMERKQATCKSTWTNMWIVAHRRVPMWDGCLLCPFYLFWMRILGFENKAISYSVGSFIHVNNVEETSIACELKPTCEWLSMANTEYDSQVGQWRQTLTSLRTWRCLCACTKSRKIKRLLLGTNAVTYMVAFKECHGSLKFVTSWLLSWHTDPLIYVSLC